jgi:predicted RNA binding protein YcfA (HicA-like mRNA interferase family)
LTRLPAVNFRRLDRALKALGFVPVRQRGSHVVYRHEIDVTVDEFQSARQRPRI